jgi:hypothetical protein
MNPVRTLRHFAGFLLAGTATLFATAVGQPPAGLGEADWARLRSTLDGARHRIAATAGGHQAHNPGQRWRTRFEGQGFLDQPDGADWQWGLELTAYGFPGREHTVPTGSANTLTDVAETRLEYAWDAGLSEWFVNDARGLEHGFTVHERPDDRQDLECGSPLPLSQAEEFTTPETSAEPKRQRTGAVQDAAAMTTTLNFRLAVRGGLRPVLEPDRHGVRFVDADGTTRTTYAGLKVWDADGRILPAHFEPLDAGRPAEITLAVDERGARYPLTIDPIAQQALLPGPTPGVGQSFGNAVAVAGDTMVVGAPFGPSGTATVYVLRNGAWEKQAEVKPTNPRPGFGYSVALSGDTLVVGNPFDASQTRGINGADNQTGGFGNNSGAAYVFVRNDSIWSQQAYLKASNAAYNEHFGWAVGISSNTVVVGAYNEASYYPTGDEISKWNTGSGAAYVFSRDGSSWRQEAFLKSPNIPQTAHFGWSVAVSGNTVAVGASQDENGTIGDNPVPEMGGAYVFVRDGTNWSHQAFLRARIRRAGDQFGWSLSLSGDTLAIGVPFEDTFADSSGAAYVFVRSGRFWRQQGYLKSGSLDRPNAGDSFGFAVSVEGDFLVVGAPYEDSRSTRVNRLEDDNSATMSGAAYIFERSGEVWKRTAFLKASNTTSDARFGTAVGISEGYAVIGAPSYDRWMSQSSAKDSGNSYVFSLTSPAIEVAGNGGTETVPATSRIRFSAVPVGGFADSIFQISNSGEVNLTDVGLMLFGSDADQFRVMTNPKTSLEPGESTTFTVRFNPTSEGTKTATLHIASNDPDQNPFDVTLVGTPNVPTVAASGNDLTVSFVGTPGSRYRVQYLPGLTGSWTDFASPALYTVPASGVFSHTDLNPPDTLRLYRAVLVP